MPKQLLTGPLEEQCAFLYDLAQKKMAEGNFTGAVYALEEIVRYVPDYPGAAQLLEEARRRKAEQRHLLLWAILGAVAFVLLGSSLQIRNDLLLLLLGALGLFVGYGAGNLWCSFRRR